jgi:hypothetical protein
VNVLSFSLQVDFKLLEIVTPIFSLQYLHSKLFDYTRLYLVEQRSVVCSPLTTVRRVKRVRPFCRSTHRTLTNTLLVDDYKQLPQRSLLHPIVSLLRRVVRAVGITFSCRVLVSRSRRVLVAFSSRSRRVLVAFSSRSRRVLVAFSCRVLVAFSRRVCIELVSRCDVLCYDVMCCVMM